MYWLFILLDILCLIYCKPRFLNKYFVQIQCSVCSCSLMRFFWRIFLGVLIASAFFRLAFFGVFFLGSGSLAFINFVEEFPSKDLGHEGSFIYEGSYICISENWWKALSMKVLKRLMYEMGHLFFGFNTVGELDFFFNFDYEPNGISLGS